jgi:hypothetical protein
LIIIGGCDPAILPESAQRRIIEHVESGSGLILSGTDRPREGALAAWLDSLALAPAPEAIMRGVGSVGIPEADQAQLVSAATAGSGRVALFTFQHAPTLNHALIPVPSNPYALLPEHETNALSLLCKAAVWATGREGGDSIHQLIDLAPKGPQDEDIPPGFPREFIEAVRKNALNQPVRPYALQLNAPSGATYDVVYQVRVPGASLPALRVDAGTELRKGADGCALDIMTAPGIYFVDIWLLNRKGVVYWHTEPLEVTGWPQLRSIDITQDGKDAVWLHPNDHLDIAVEVEPGGFLTAGGEASVRARAVDSFGREVAHALSPITPEGGAVSLRLELADLLAPLVRVEVIASEDSLANQAARSTYYFPVRLPDSPMAPTVALVSPGPFDYATGRQLARLRTDLGASLLHAPATVESLLAASLSGLQRIAQVGSLDAGHLNDLTVRSPCLSSEAFWERESGQIKSGVLASWAGGPPAHSLGAEVALTGTDANVCQSPDCLAHFRTALREYYGDIGRLNQAWGSAFSTWADVTPVALDQCQQTGKWAPWLDFRLAMNDVLPRALERGRAIVQEVPGAGRCGFVSPRRIDHTANGIRLVADRPGFGFHDRPIGPLRRSPAPVLPA